MFNSFWLYHNHTSLIDLSSLIRKKMGCLILPSFVHSVNFTSQMYFGSTQVTGAFVLTASLKGESFFIKGLSILYTSFNNLSLKPEPVCPTYFNPLFVFSASKIGRA